MRPSTDGFLTVTRGSARPPARAMKLEGVVTAVPEPRVF